MRWTCLLIAVAGLTACQKKSAPEPAPQTTTAPVEAAEWEGCRELKQTLADATMKFSDPEYSGEIETWRVSLFGVNFALPQGDWDVLPSRDENGSMTVVLVERESDETVVWTLEPHATPGTPANERPTTVHQKLVTGYQKTPDDLTCAKAAEKDEAPIAEALVLKNIDAPGKTIAVHNNTHGLNDIARFSSLDDHGQWQWEVWFPTPLGYAQATYRFKDEARAKAFAGSKSVAPGELKDTATDMGGPKWLGLLETAIGDPAAADGWKSLLAERKKAGAGGKSIGAIEKLAEQPAP